MELFDLKSKELKDKELELNNYKRELQKLSEGWSELSKKIDKFFAREAERREFAQKLDRARRDAAERRRDRAFREDLRYSIYLGIVWGLSFGMIAGYLLWRWARESLPAMIFGELPPPTILESAFWGIGATIFPLSGMFLFLTSYRILKEKKKENNLSMALLGTPILGIIFGIILFILGLPVRSITIGSLSFSLLLGSFSFLLTLSLALKKGERTLTAFQLGSRILPLMMAIGGVIGLITGGIIPLDLSSREIIFAYILTIPNAILWAIIFWFIGSYVRFGGSIRELFIPKEEEDR